MNTEWATIILTVVGGGLALWRYWSDQVWKKRKFAYDYAESIFANPAAMTALHMIDYGSGVIPKVVAEEYELADADRRWDQAEVVRALRAHDDDPANPASGLFTDKEFVIRELFDTCLSRFERLGHLMKDRAISTADYPSSLFYYVRVLEEGRATALGKQLDRYIVRYRFENTRYLFERLRDRSPKAAPALPPVTPAPELEGRATAGGQRD
jgi:hypothetical protein